MKNITALLFIIVGLTRLSVAEEISKSWSFGSGGGRDGDGGFSFINTSDSNGTWSEQSDSLQFNITFDRDSGESRTESEAAVLVDLQKMGLEPETDFSVELTVETRGVWEWNRFGIVALVDRGGEQSA